MLGLVGETKPLSDGSDDPLHDDDDDLDDPIQDSPALSASPPPAPPPLPPPVRNGCQRCRFSQLASANSTLNRSHPHLASGTGTLGSGSIGGGTLTRPHRAGANGGTLERNQHMAASSGHLHTAGGVATTAASAGTGNGTYPGYDRNRLLEEEDSAYPALLERELHSLHRNVPALRRAGVDTTAIRQHFYPDGGWGWIVCGVAFLAHVLTTGFQLSYGLLLLYAIRHLGHEVNTEAGWLGPASWAMSLFSATIVVALCRRKSTRLTAVLGGLVLALGILFTSFATQLHQVAFSYGVIVGIGSAMVRESAAVMLGHYFKRRRQFVEMITMSGEGVGVALFSVILKEGVGKMGWRLGLQAVTGLVSCSFFMGLLYRPASLYHPQRRAILHLKNQRKKVKEKKTHVRTPKPPFLDFTPLKSSSVRMLSISASVAALGVYSPIFFLSLHGFSEGYDMQDLVLLQTFLGLSIALGIVFSGSSINKTLEISFRKVQISRQYVCQGCVTLVSLSLLVLSAVADYRGLCFSAWAYGLGLGGYRYTLKMLAIERIRGKYFSKAWGFIKGAESLPVLFGVPLCAFLNDSSHRYGRAGYYICAASAAISAIILFFVGYPDGRNMKYSTNGSITSRCTAPTSSSDCQHILDRSFSSQRYNNPHWYGTSTHTTSLANGCHGSGSYAGPGPVGLQRCLSTSQFMNGGLNLSSAGALGPGTAVSSAGTGVGGAGLSVGGVGGGVGGVGGHLLGNSQSLDNPSTVAGGFNSYHSAFCGQGSSYHPGGGGRLQKSLSFAFQTPPMFSDEPMHHTCQQASYAADYPPPSRCYSRCEVHNPSSLATPVTVHRDTFGRHHSFRGTTGSSSRGQTPRHTAVHPAAGRTGGGQGPATPHHHQYHHSQQQQQQQHHQHHQQLPPYPVNGLQYHPSRSRSVPEGLGGSVRAGAAGGGPGAFTDCHWNHCHWTAADRANFCRPHRPIQVVEQITTSV
uniref:Major facilitator superfamily (MFS) profile domain-containing protein n=1 Tax=Anopheles atroparvus TaxID=41427 RepID=A0AAG5DSK7_ANOAO